MHSLSHSSILYKVNTCLRQEASLPSGVTIRVKVRPSHGSLMHDEFRLTKLL
jgi:hypothetical protein